MNKNLFVIIFFFAAFSFSFAQEVTFDKVKQQFERLDYDSVIKNSDKLIKDNTVGDSLMIEVHLMRALVFYTTGKDSLIKKSFESILGIKNNYVPDPFVISSKLIPIFNTVRTEFFTKHPELALPTDLIPPKEQVQPVIQEIPKSAIIENILIPGIGQFHSGNTVKGLINTTVSVLNLGAIIYFSSDASTKQNEYLNETNKNLIPGKYDDYNKSYKLRNIFIITYAAIWLYSQLDLLFFSNQKEPKESLQIGSYINLIPGRSDFQLDLRLPIHF